MQTAQQCFRLLLTNWARVRGENDPTPVSLYERVGPTVLATNILLLEFAFERGKARGDSCVAQQTHFDVRNIKGIESHIFCFRNVGLLVIDLTSGTGPRIFLR